MSNLMEKHIESSLNNQRILVNVHNTMLISCGIPSVDTVLGGGLPVGTLCLIEEDLQGFYSEKMLKYFIAEGITNQHSMFVASQDNPTGITYEIPAAIESVPEQLPKIENETKMTIAFRYQNVPVIRKEEVINGHYYDLTKTVSNVDMQKMDISRWSGGKIENCPNSFCNPAYNELLKSIKCKIKEGKFFLKDNPSNNSVLRIAIHSLGSPMWLPNKRHYRLVDSSRDLELFLFCLRALVRSACAVAVVTIPSHLYHENSLERCIHSSDIAIRLQSFTGTELETNETLSKYNGFFSLTKLAPINSFTSKHPGSVEYVFKLYRRKFVVEKLHLPPDIQESDSKTSSSFGCAVSNRNLDF